MATVIDYQNVGRDTQVSHESGGVCFDVHFNPAGSNELIGRFFVYTDSPGADTAERIANVQARATAFADNYTPTGGVERTKETIT